MSRLHPADLRTLVAAICLANRNITNWREDTKLARIRAELILAELARTQPAEHGACTHELNEWAPDDHNFVCSVCGLWSYDDGETWEPKRTQPAPAEDTRELVMERTDLITERDSLKARAEALGEDLARERECQRLNCTVIANQKAEIERLCARVAELEAKPRGIGDGDIIAALAERDRYRAALERIVGNCNNGAMAFETMRMQVILRAEEALRGGEGA